MKLRFSYLILSFFLTKSDAFSRPVNARSQLVEPTNKIYSNTRLYSTVAGASTSTPLPPAIVLEKVTCSHDGGSTYQLNGVSYVLPRGGKIGLVGVNGCGKSTLLKILAESCCDVEGNSVGGGGSQINRDEGVVYTGNIEKGKGCRVSYVEQDPPMSSDVTVADAVLGITSTSEIGLAGNKDVYNAVRKYRLAAANAESDPDTFTMAMADMESLGGWNVLTKADEVATRLRVKHLENTPLSKLSGGERKRCALAAALVQEPDVLLLDEPTNHLDLQAIRWISDMIQDQPKTTLLTVTHDRAFLEDVCNTILELDRGSLYSYQGSYSNFLEQKASRLAAEDASIQSAKTKYRGELEWMRRQPQARATKQKARIDAFYKLEKSTKPRASDPHLDLAKDGQQRLGNNVLKLKNVSLKFGDKIILDDFSYNFNRGDRIGIVGSNGVGKSTLIKVLIEQQPIDSGSLETGETVVFGIYDQLGIEIDGNMKVMDFVKESVETASGPSLAEAPEEARKLLKQFQFDRSRWQERVSFLSGGEQRRLQLLSVLTKRPNFLVLDEPTNDLDLDTISALESYLASYDGVLVVVSHDRFFTDKVTDHLFVFEGNGVVKDFAGTLSDYAECLIEDDNTGGFNHREDKQSTYKEDKKARMQRQNQLKSSKKEMNNLDNKMEKLRDDVTQLEIQIEESANEGWTILADLTAKMDKAKEDIDEKEMRWLELAEEIETAEEQSV